MNQTRIFTAGAVFGAMLIALAAWREGIVFYLIGVM